MSFVIRSLTEHPRERVRPPTDLESTPADPSLSVKAAKACRWDAGFEIEADPRGLSEGDVPKPSCVFDVLPEHDSYAVDVAHTELANSIRLVRWLLWNLGISIDDFFVVSVDILDPLEQMDATRSAFVSHEVNRGVIPPHDCVGVVAKIPRKAQQISIERCGGRDIRDVQHGCTLNELFGIRRRQCWHRPSWRDDSIEHMLGGVRPYFALRTPSSPRFTLLRRAALPLQGVDVVLPPEQRHPFQSHLH